MAEQIIFSTVLAIGSFYSSFVLVTLLFKLIDRIDIFEYIVWQIKMFIIKKRSISIAVFKEFFYYIFHLQFKDHILFQP